MKNLLGKILVTSTLALVISGISAQDQPIEIDSNAVYFGVEKFESPTLISEHPTSSQWHLRLAPGMCAYGDFIFHPPEILPSQDITADPGLCGKYDIYIGMRAVSQETSVQFKLAGMTDYYTVVLPGTEKHSSVEVPVAAGVIMDNKKLSLHATGQGAYIGYFKFVISGEKTLTPSSMVSIKSAMPLKLN
jgi:hypothetical protein